LTITSVLKLGSRGEQVYEWQNILIEDRYDLSPWFNNSIFEESTYNATISWQKERGLPGTGIVDEATIAKIGTGPGPISDPFNEDLEIKFIQAEYYSRANRTEIKSIIIHVDKAIELSSVHFYVDDLTIIQHVKEEDIAHHSSSNDFSIGIELAGYVRQTENQWFDSYSTQMLKRSAKLIAYLCKKWNIPIKCNKECGITIYSDPEQKFPMKLYMIWIQQCFDDLG
jgi:hypothetical protein